MNREAIRWWAVLALIAAIEVILLKKLLTTTSHSGLLFATIVIALLLVVILRIDDLNRLFFSKSTFEVNLSEIRQEVNKVENEINEKVLDVENRQDLTEKKQDEIQEILNALSIALEGIVTSYERDHLEKLRSENDDTVTFGSIFFHEMERLDAIGFISPIRHGGLLEMKQDQETSGNLFHLRDYVKLTEKGKNYLDVTFNINNGGIRSKFGS